MNSGRIQQNLSAGVRAGRYAFALAIVVCVAVGVYLTIADKTSSLTVKLSGLGINLIAAAAFSTIFALLVDRENRSIEVERLDERFEEHTTKVLKAVENLNSAFLPAAVYAPVQAYDQSFNRSLMDDLNHSSFYYFRGPSAKYVAARLRALRRRPDHIRVYVPGPASAMSIKFDIANRSRTGPDTHANVQALYKRFSDDLLSALVGLFDCRAYGRIEVFLCDDTLVSRHEVTERHLYTSWYTSVQNTSGIKFPETSVFSRQSIHYQAMAIDMERRASFAHHSLMISPEIDVVAFRTQLESIFGATCLEDEIERISRAYWSGRSEFLTFLRAL